MLQICGADVNATHFGTLDLPADEDSENPISDQDKVILMKWLCTQRQLRRAHLRKLTRFIFDLTQFADKLFALPVENRKAELRRVMSEYQLPDGAYIPLCSSHENIKPILRLVPHKMLG